MAVGYSKPLYLLAFDHRGSFERDLFDASQPISEQVRTGIVHAKEVIYDGFVEATGRGVPHDAAGILVDEQYGTSVARQARRAGSVLAMPVEKSGQPEFDFECGEEFGRHIEEFDPTFAKVLVRYNPQGDTELNRRQTERLARLDLAPPAGLRPRLTPDGIAPIADSGVSGLQVRHGRATQICSGTCRRVILCVRERCSRRPN